MSRRLHRGALAAAFAVALGVGVAGCGAGFDAQSYLVDPDNAEASVGGLLVRNLVMVKHENAPVAGIVGTFVNSTGQTDVLETVQIEGGEGSAGQSALSVTAGLELPPRSAISVGTGDAPALAVSDAEQLKVGTFVTMTLTFREAGAVELKVPLEDAYSYYATVAPTAPPTGTPGVGTPGAGTPVPGATTPLEQPGLPSPTAS